MVLHYNLEVNLDIYMQWAAVTVQLHPQSALVTVLCPVLFFFFIPYVINLCTVY